MRRSKVTCPHSYRDKAKELGETGTGLELQCDVNALTQWWNLLQHQHKCQNPINCWALVKAFGKRPKELSESCFGASPANTLSPVTLVLRRTQLVSLRENGWFPPTIAERAVQNVAVGTRTSSTDPTRKPSLFCSATWRGALVFILQILRHLNLWPLPSILSNLMKTAGNYCTLVCAAHRVQVCRAEGCLDVYNEAHPLECPKRKKMTVQHNLES